MAESVGLPLVLERDAMHGKELPTGLGFADQILYLQLRMLYDQYRRNVIDREMAALEKKKLLREHRTNKLREQMCNRWVELIKKTEAARADYRKDRTIENADKLLSSIDGIPCG